MVQKPKSKVILLNDGVNFNLSQKKALKNFIISIFRAEKRDLDSIIYIFSSDLELLKINRTYLKHNYLTDIITFNLSDNVNHIIGESYISIERVRENSKSLKIRWKYELHRVIFHGALHLCGYSDKSKTQRLKMRERENHYLSKYFKKSFT
jgi:rRNA maturation RNase YbeY